MLLACCKKQVVESTKKKKKAKVTPLFIKHKIVFSHQQGESQRAISYLSY